MSFIEKPKRKYDDGRTKQSFKNSTDINKILAKAQKSGALSHLEQYGGQYGDFSDFDFHEAHNQLAKAKEIFGALPSQIRKDFGNDPANFFEFANDPKNADDLAELLPEIAEPGKYFPDVNAVASSGQARAPETQKEAPAIPEPETPSEPDSGA